MGLLLTDACGYRSVLATREMLLLAPYCFHIGVAISFTTFFYREIRDTRAYSRQLLDTEIAHFPPDFEYM